MTDKSELERVRAIHEQASVYLRDVAAGCWPDTDEFCVQGDPDAWWTREELLAWPERLEAMRARLLDLKGLSIEHSYVFWLGKNNLQLCDCPGVGGRMTNYPEHKDQLARGICLYREMLTDEQSAAVGELEHRCVVCGNGTQFGYTRCEACDARECALAGTAPKPVDPYEQHRLLEGHKLQVTGPDAIARNEAARARNIAVLRLELDRPLSIADQQHPREWFSGHVRRYR